ncbi:MAG: heavy-metal-associated domain-containing protein [Alphaproteobacteria bacterium]|nr:heavy-metal-associated domain-containing protein [Alphaproteobacteria bacterium]
MMRFLTVPFLLSCLYLVGGLCVGVHQAKADVVRIKVDNMYCESCWPRLQRLADQAPGDVAGISYDREERVVAVDLVDGVQWSDQQLVNWLALAGYEARTVQHQPITGFPTRPRPPFAPSYPQPLPPPPPLPFR